MILVPSVLPNLFRFQEQQRIKDAIKPLFTRAGNDEQLRQRMKERGDSPLEIQERMQACHRFELDAAASEIPYIYIDNTGALEASVDDVMEVLRPYLTPSLTPPQ
ncbi:hypothetical protein GF380_05520 [Candidatus Uhrbacteria bacterium]|nr:hypothetical protein [Candidatus Uhrbacteria bacterium]